MADAAQIDVEVAFALPERQTVVSLRVPVGCSAFEAVDRSGIAAQFECHDLLHAPMGIFGSRLDDPRAYRLRAGDRVEIYRALSIDPKAARRKRARAARR